MLIAIIGTRFSGKSTVEDYFVSKSGFRCVRIVEEGEALNQGVRRRFPLIGSPAPPFLSKRAQQISNQPVSVKTVPPSPPVDGPIVRREAQIPATLHTLPVAKSEQTNETLRFRSAQELLKHVTENWQSNFVTLDLRTRKTIELFVKRPLFMLLSLDGPLHQRFLRSKRYI